MELSGDTLYILSGIQQTGKTRSLESLLERMEHGGILVAGVIAPGVWRKKEDGELEKLGIDNVLLPSRKRIHFARRRDLLEDSDLQDCTASERMKLTWAIDDNAIAAVNRHFDDIVSGAQESTDDTRAKILIVDELGRIELERNEGLVSAIDALKRAPELGFENAIAIVRPDLIESAKNIFEPYWGDVRVIGIDDIDRMGQNLLPI